ncbi:MFS transporter [Oceanihabitans sediminis]|uniref:MFS transporter n=1 Tax=Oceanihabitans sediminis TaxID=1812012 RepID=A0A368P814_9FLAO|nr:MFS transporter [Oceanihabitans sediminis]MDX1277246.1 MFS transporter [Oceanihabitans sediminis]MDX1773665.1 MFS transporter [Oceanihabitans sediminis]RBP33109.1 CP family cyanate transporter-like MFS transporter [Oceanihabitans sediminis]RCU57381.1 MFS transporter [Oceanihabitans sediminis]
MAKLDENGLTKAARTLLLVGVLFVAINLRPALSSIGPLIDMIRQDVGLSDTLLGLLTTLPLIAFGVVSTITPLFTKRFGIGNTLLGALITLATGIIIRSLGGVFELYLGTILLGIAIAFGNVLIPALIKRNFPHKAGFVTSLYSGVMSLGAAFAAGLSVPLAVEFNLGWRGSLVSWSVLAILAIIIWIPNIKRINRTPPSRSFKEAMKKLSGTLLVWKLALYMGLQSLAFYVILAWLPAILIDRGYDEAYAGWMLSLSQGTGILGAIIIPVWAGSRKDQRLVIVSLIVIEILAFIGLMFPELGMVELWIGLIGMVLGGTFGLALLLIVLRAKDSETAAELSGIVQSIGYFIAATGPFIVGMIYDLTHVWNYALILLVGVSVLKLIMGIDVGKDKKI